MFQLVHPQVQVGILNLAQFFGSGGVDRGGRRIMKNEGGDGDEHVVMSVRFADAE